MKTRKQQKTLLLLCVGLFIIAASQIISYYVQLTDFIKGSATGIGIGLLLTALIFSTSKTNIKSSN
ncbi:hypothetical protein HSX10_11715 [Winogradskyella undariae]|uniref:hypothetical protein n=1 Tax=Winogradskyella TaxID=286104 RepID=UPI00156B522D|nr:MULTISPECIES: hypothetical protein [Winogradskyella]NRR92235.1 hypothetical protein [Winogradskyella undariae]QXP78258.1 hypothetical protein H0I32_13675 [Winogradskyella sp. HaHa_3_26]